MSLYTYMLCSVSLVGRACRSASSVNTVYDVSFTRIYIYVQLFRIRQCQQGRVKYVVKNIYTIKPMQAGRVDTFGVLLHERTQVFIQFVIS